MYLCPNDGKPINLHIHTVRFFAAFGSCSCVVFSWIMCFTSSYLSYIVVCSSFIIYATLLSVDLSMFVIGHLL